MEYTKGKWAREEVNDTMICILAPDSITGEETYQYIAEIDPCCDERFAPDEIEANAHLIAAAVNACASVNPDNPIAVAYSVKDMYEALQDLLDEYQITEADTEINVSSNWVKAWQALAKAEG